MFLLAGEQIVEGVQVWYASMCEYPVAAYNACFLSVDGCGDGADVVGIHVHLSVIYVVYNQDGYPSSTHGGSVWSGSYGESFYFEVGAGLLVWFHSDR